jgi:transglutaminase-like putative cysteine protease
VALVGWAPPAHAHSADYTVVRDIRTIHLHRNLGHTEDHTEVLRVDSKDAIESLSRRRLTFIPSRESLRIVEAWTQTRDGKRHLVPPDRIVAQSNARSSTESIFTERQALVVLFPQVAVGAELHVRSVLTRREPIFPGHYSEKLWWSPHYPHAEVAVDMLVDPGVKLRSATRDKSGQLRGGQVAAQPADPPGSTRYRWTYAHPGAEPAFTNQVDEDHYAPMLVFGTFATWGEVARAYRARATPQSTPALRAKAREIVEGARSLMERVERITNWVSREIRYVAVTVGDAGYVPHSAQAVLDNGVGDCKDKSLLLEALLAAVGIEAGPALVDSTKVYELPPHPTPFAFDHVIVHVPALNLYLEPTHGYARAGTLPQSLMGKPVLRVREGRLDRIPHMNPALDFSQARLTAGMVASGAVLGATEAVFRGALEADSRITLAQALDREGVRRYAQRLLARQFEPGSGSFTADPQALDEPLEVKATFELEPLVNRPGVGAMRIPLALGPGRIFSLLNRHAYTDRRRPYVCESVRHEETYTLDFPEGTTVEAAPPAVDFQKSGITYRARYELKGRTLTATRTYVAKWPGPICEAKDDLVWEEFRPVLLRDLRAQVVVR